MNNNFDAIAFKFVQLLEERPLIQAGSPPNENLIGTDPIYDLGEVEDLKILKTEPYGSNVSAFHAVDKNYVGLSEVNYEKFKQFITQIQDIPIFSTKTSFSFIETKSFDWLIDVYKSKKAEKGLIDHLLDRIEEEYKEYTFYFKINPFAIEVPFSIGNAEITFFDESFLDRERRKFTDSGKTIEEFDSLFKDFKNTVLMKVRAKGVESRAQEIAFYEAEIAADILKCLLHEFSVYGQYKLPDIDHRVVKRENSVFIYNYPSDKFSFIFSVLFKGDRIPIEVDKVKFNEQYSRAVEKFSHFLKHSKEDEFYYTIINSIRSFSDITSTNNRYDRVVKIISFFEAIVIDAGTKKGKGETKIKNDVIPKILKTAAEVKLGIELTSYFYRIRDAYIHHRIEKLIDYKKIYQFQTIAFRVPFIYGGK